MLSAALIVVNYKTGPLAVDAIRTARAATSGPLQVIVVDNSVDVQQAEMLRPHADVLIVAERNLGYAAAINRGRKAADAGTLIVSNPDIRFGRGAIDELLAADATVAGPALFWDDGHQWMMPPSELQTSLQILDRALASRAASWSRWRDRRRIRARLAFWALEKTTVVRALSGAVLAIRSDAFDRASGFDERFPLYFEENDFLRRVGGKIAYVPAARCRHIYNQSAAGSSDAAALFEESRRAYIQKWSGRWLSHALERLERPVSAKAAAPIDGPLQVTEGALVEASPLPSFETAAGHFARSAAVTVPPDVWSSYRGSVLFFRVIERRSGNVIATYARSKISP